MYLSAKQFLTLTESTFKVYSDSESDHEVETIKVKTNSPKVPRGRGGHER